MADTSPPAFPGTGGLTKREYFAGLILHALIVHGGLPRDFQAEQTVSNIGQLADNVVARLTE